MAMCSLMLRIGAFTVCAIKPALHHSTNFSTVTVTGKSKIKLMGAGFAIPIPIRWSKFSICHQQHHFCSDAAAERQKHDGQLLNFLKSQIKLKHVSLETPRRAATAIPNEFPFTINKLEEEEEEDNLIFTREFHGEKIQVVVVDDHYEDDDDEDSWQSVSLTATVTKQNGKSSEFKVSAFADKIEVHSVLLKESGPPPLLSFGPYTLEDEGDLQRALTEFLEIRGIDITNCKLFYKCICHSNRKKPLAALKMLTNFVNEYI